MSTLQKKKEKIVSFCGTLVASVTPFADDGRTNEAAIESYVNHLVKMGVKGAYVHGTTGEGLSLAHEEKKSLTKKWVQVVRRINCNFLLVVNVSSCCIDDALDHAKLCEQLHVDAIAFLPPFYHRPNDAAHLAQYVETICKSVDNTPVFYYHYPEITGVRITPSQWIPLVLDKCPNLSAVKFTDRDMSELARSLKMFDGRVAFYPGYEETTLIASALGARAFIGALFNLPEGVEFNQRIVDAVKRGDMLLAKEQQDKMVDLIDRLVASPGLIPNLKSLLTNKHNLEVGVARPPIHFQ